MTIRQKRAVIAFPVIAALLVAIGLYWKTSTDESSSDGTLAQKPKPFAANSFWNTRLDRDVDLDPNSSRYVSEFLRQVGQKDDVVYINTTNYSPPVYEVPLDQPVRKVKWFDCQKNGMSSFSKALEQQFAEVPLPDDAVPSDGTDKEIVVWQRDADVLWDFWKAEKSNGEWRACWGGKLEGVSHRDGRFEAPFGTTASGLPLIGGLIRIEELQSGRIEHALSLSLLETQAKQFVWPASRTDGKSNSPNAIPEGQRFRLDPSVDIDDLSLSKAGKSIAHAIQDYGFVVRDVSGAVTLYAENPSDEADRSGWRNPYNEIFHGDRAYQVLEGFPWDRLQAISPDVGRASS